jgi:hypothetical protein
MEEPRPGSPDLQNTQNNDQADRNRPDANNSLTPIRDPQEHSSSKLIPWITSPLTDPGKLVLATVVVLLVMVGVVVASWKLLQSLGPQLQKPDGSTGMADMPLNYARSPDSFGDAPPPLSSNMPRTERRDFSNIADSIDRIQQAFGFETKSFREAPSDLADFAASIGSLALHIPEWVSERERNWSSERTHFTQTIAQLRSQAARFEVLETQNARLAAQNRAVNHSLSNAQNSILSLESKNAELKADLEKAGFHLTEALKKLEEVKKPFVREVNDLRAERDRLRLDIQQATKDRSEALSTADKALKDAMVFRDEANDLIRRYSNGLPGFVAAIRDGNSCLALLLRISQSHPVLWERFDVALRAFKCANDQENNDYVLVDRAFDIGVLLFEVMKNLSYDTEQKRREAEIWAEKLMDEGKSRFGIIIPHLGVPFDTREMRDGTPGGKVLDVRSWGIRDKRGFMAQKAIVG